MNVLTLQPEAQRRAHQEAAQSNTIFCGVSPEIKNRAAYSDFKALQVKTLSFIAYILRMFQTTLRPHEDTIADVIVQILKDCPLKQRLLASVLVDLILHVRAELSRQQISRIIHIYSKKLLDTSFVPNIQIVCAKLLCNMIDCLIDTTGTNREGRTLLIRILDAYSRKFTALSLSFPSIIKAHMKKKSVSNSIQESLSYNLDIDGFLDLGYVQPIKTATRMLDTFPDIVAESRALIKNLIQGVKPILQALRQYNPAAPLNSDLETYNSVARGFSEDEVEIFVRIFKDGLKCFEYYNSDNYGPDGLLLEKPPQSLSKDDKEAFEKFAAIFTGVEPCVFQEVLSSQMPLLFERILINPGLQAIPQYLLGLVNTAPNFHNAAPNFVAIEMLGSDDHVFSATMLRLFKVVFMAVTKYPTRMRWFFVLTSGYHYKIDETRVEVEGSYQFFPTSSRVVQNFENTSSALTYNKIEHSHATMRILGSLGSESSIHWRNSQVLVLDKLLPAAHAILGNPSSSKFYVEQAFIFAKSCLPLLIDLDNCSIDESTLSHLVGKLREDMAMEIDPLALPRAKKEAFDDMLRMTISLFFAATTFVDVRDAAWDVISNLCYQFAHVSVAEALEDSLKAKKKQKGTQVDNFVNSPVTRSDGFIDAIVESFCSESADQRKYAEKALQTFANACKSLLSSWPNFCIDDMSVFHTFASRFCSCCYQQEWFKKSGGCHGISFLCSQLDLTPKWIIDHELEFVKALLFILKDASPEMASTNTEDATLTLSHVLKVCNNRPKDESETPQPQDPKFNSLVSLLISELSNSNATVRETIQSTFQLLADLTGTDVTSMLNLVRDRLLQPIFAKPLRALPFAMQIGNIDAITFCLQLRPPMLEFSDELVRLLHEALALADAEDQALVSNKPNPNRNITSLTNLRVVCIRLLATAMICPEFMNARHTSLRSRIISVFFKSMYVKSPEINQAAYKGLQKVLSHQFKLPKDLLQAGLRPILVNLGDYKRLSVVALDGLARLLELLTNYFKVEIGRKLLDHMRHWAEPAALEDASGKPLSEIEAVKILVAIVNVFHLLPATANIFFDDLVKSVLDLEMLIKRNISSPFRAPLIKYLNRYPTETVGYFLERMGMPSYGKLFFCVLRSEHAVAVRQEVINDPAKIIQRCFPPENNPTNDYLSFCGVQITQEILTYVPDWLHQNPELLVKLREHWDRVLTRSTESVETPNMFLNEYQCILEIFVNICRQETFDIDVLFEIIKALTSPELVDVTFVKHFIYQDVIVGFSPAKKKGVLKHFFRNWTNFSMDLRQVPSFHDHTHALAHPFLTESIQDSAVVDDAFKVELLQLTTLLVRFAPSVINELRKEVIKFAWNHLLKVEDVTCKQAAYVLLARFIEQFDTPTKIVIQIFVALLRSQQHEGRVLVKQALNILIPVLPRRLPSTAADLRVPLWVRWTRKIIVEDGHSLPQLVTIYQLLIRHADLFYKSKDHFIPNIISSLARLGLSPLATPETKSLSIELGDLILQWDRKRLTEMDSADDSQMEDPGNMSRIGYREMLLGYFIRFVCTSAAGDSSAAANFIGKSVEIIKSNLEVSPDIPVKFSHFEKALPIELKEENAPIASNAADLLNIIMERKPAAWISANLGFIQKCIESWIRYESASVVMSLQPIFQKIHQLIHSEASKDDPPAEVASFTKLTESVISKGLQSMTNPLGVLSILSAAYEFRPTGLEDKVIENLLKLFQKLTTEFCAEGPSDPANPVESKSGMIQMALSFIKVALPHMKEHRKGYLECLSQLIIEGSDIKVLYRILELVKWWILESSEPFPTAKEKANLMVKLLAIEGKNEKPLIVDYLSLVLQIYTTPAFARTELTVRLEKAFLWGTRFEEPELRRKFCDIFSISVEPYLHSRLYYIVGVQIGSTFPHIFGLSKPLILLGSISVNERLLNCVPGYRVGCEMRIEDGMLVDTEQKMDVDLEESSPKMQHVKFIESLKELYLKDMLLAVREFVYVDTALASHLWTTLFPICWNLLHPNERQLLTKMFVPLLAKEYHTKQADLRPNVIQVLLDGLCKCIPIVSLPPVLIKYLGRTFNAWYTGLEYLHNMVLDNKTVDVKEEDKARDSIMDSFGELLYAVAEEDLYFGLVKRRCLFTETNVAASFEQNGMWANAQHYYEAAQAKARSGVMPYTESEYSFWEEHWVACDADLLLECAWRLSDWISEREFLQTTVQGLPEGKGCRKKVYEAFLALQTLQNNGGDKEKAQFKNICEQGVQLALKSWLALPQQITNAHIPILHAFQQFVELQEAAQMQENLTATSAQNIETKSQELKGLLLTWRERLPNMWDDINIWSDLVAWRQHVFTTINKAYNPLISTLTQPAGSTNAASSYAYRGYHETAWIINRFSHVARKHQLMDVCISSLSKIYTLPNIEIPEAFYKLREQAKCYFQSPSEYSNGLEVINNTNLQFFSKPQTAEFFALKGVFLQKLNLHDDATQAFSSAIQISDMKLPQSMGRVGDQPNEMKFGINAVMCYLHAAGQYNNARSRKYLARLLWLLSLDDNEQSMTKTWENQKGRDSVVALHFQLRTAKEDYMAIKKQALSTTPKEPSAGELQANGANGENKDGGAAGGNNHATPVRRQPWEYVEEVMALLKTAFPLLALSMETMVDQMAQRLKPNTDEDIFRLIVALLNDGVQQLCRDPGDVSQICQATEYNLARFAESMNPNHLKLHSRPIFIKSKPNLSQLIMKFREWRDRLENLLYSRPRRQHLEQYSHYLIEFEYQKFDDIDVPGQYFLLKDNNKDFIRIERFMPEVDTVRGHTSCLRRITIRGHDGSLHPFLVQHPANRHCRREERILQLFRILNSVLERKKESRRRSLAFHLPVIVPLAPLEIFEEHCQISGLSRDDPVLFYISRLREFYLTEDVSKRGKVEMLNLKTEIMDEIGKRMIPETILSREDGYIHRSVVDEKNSSPHKWPPSPLSNANFLFANTESVNFRLTPNIQHFITPIGMEGPFSSNLMSIARSLVEPEHELEDYLSVFVKDELIAWQNMGKKPALQDHQLRDLVNQNVDLVVKRTNGLSCKMEREKAGEGNPVPSNQTIVDLISQAGNPLKLAQMEPTFLAML
ncbi:FAT domain-containing protein [Chytridium lagenaria]|nr:FAT domain-containing protein [Chytridium lagenaria]